MGQGLINVQDEEGWEQDGEEDDELEIKDMSKDIQIIKSFDKLSERVSLVHNHITEQQMIQQEQGYYIRILKKIDCHSQSCSSLVLSTISQDKICKKTFLCQEKYEYEKNILQEYISNNKVLQPFFVKILDFDCIHYSFCYHAGYFTLRQLNEEKLQRQEKWVESEIVYILKQLSKAVIHLAENSIYISNINPDTLIFANVDYYQDHQHNSSSTNNSGGYSGYNTSNCCYVDTFNSGSNLSSPVAANKNNQSKTSSSNSPEKKYIKSKYILNLLISNFSMTTTQYFELRGSPNRFFTNGKRRFANKFQRFQFEMFQVGRIICYLMLCALSQNMRNRSFQNSQLSELLLLQIQVAKLYSSQLLAAIKTIVSCKYNSIAELQQKLAFVFEDEQKGLQNLYQFTQSINQKKIVQQIELINADNLELQQKMLAKCNLYENALQIALQRFSQLNYSNLEHQRSLYLQLLKDIMQYNWFLQNYQEVLDFFACQEVNIDDLETIGDQSWFLNQLAQANDKLKKYDQAASCYRRALELDKQIYGDANIRLVQTMTNLSLVLESLDQLQEAEEFCRRAIEIQTLTYGQSYPGLAITLSNLAIILEAENQLENAEELCRKAIEIEERAFGVEYPELSKSYCNLGSILESQEKYEEAEFYYLKSLEMKKKAYGEEYVGLAITLNNLGGIYTTLQKFEMADQCYKQAINLEVKNYGKFSLELRDTYNSYAWLQELQKKYNEALNYYKEAQKIESNLMCQETKEFSEYEESMQRLQKLMLSSDVSQNKI